jgi:hypothetical protein
MGNSIVHNPHNYQNIIRKTSSALAKNAIMVFQIRNFKKVLTKGKRLAQFKIVKGKTYDENAFLEFYNSPQKGTIIESFALFDFDGRKWKFYGLRNSLFAHLTKEKIIPILKGNGFNKLSFHGSKDMENWGFLFKKPFDLLDSDWLNVIARR